MLENMEFLPVSLNIEVKKVLNIGGGKVALHKIRLLQRFKVGLTVIGEKIDPQIKVLSLSFFEKKFEATDLKDFFLVYVCTNNRQLNATIVALCHEKNILVNVTDDPDSCDFVSPAIYKKGHLSVSVASNAQNVKRSIEIRNFLSGVLACYPLLTEIHPKNIVNISSSDDRFAQQHRLEPGKVALVGFGPGNPELLTLRAMAYLSQADIIFHDALLDSQFLNHFAAEKVSVGKRCGNHERTQDEINSFLFEAASSLKKVVRLKGGDPMIFGRAGEELSFLIKNKIEVEVVPGISSAMAAAAQYGIPLTQRAVASSVAFCHGHYFNNKPFPKAETLVFFMGGKHQCEIAQKLIHEGWSKDTPVALISNASSSNSSIKVNTLSELSRNTILTETPILIVVGKTLNECTILQI
jgi:uroporphyrin-III C-methyltransferase/precorrin-2 dehydrogenase/sirohydrochlorin ferrochelatase